MNESGGPVVAISRFYKVAVERIVVVHDELDLPFGDLRLKRGGGEGGHNGLKSTIAALGSQGLRPGPVRHRPSAGPAGPGRLRAARVRRAPSARTWRS